VPATSLLKTYRDGPHPQAWEQFSDCFTTTVDRPVSLDEFVYAFYTSPVFRLERAVLRLLKLPSTDAEARAVAEGTGDTFAAWRVGQRTATQLLMCDVMGRTRSWFAVTPLGAASQSGTVLQFGSGIAATIDAATGQRGRSLGFRLLGDFHIAYSHVLLGAAKARL
jgi:hypothetical protein